MDLESILLICAYLISIIACQFSLIVIREYHKSKPLGMQTLLSEVTVIYTRVLGIANLVKSPTFCLVELFAPFPRLGDGNKILNQLLIFLKSFH